MENNIIPFNEYFNNWLYEQDGYYTNYKAIGKEGDFYTAVSTSKFFGGSIAKRIIDSIENGFLNHETSIIEIGAHHGYLLADIVQFIFTLRPQLIKSLTFIIIEKHEHLRKKQKDYFFQSFGKDINLIHYNDIIEMKVDNAFVIANEIYDAFPCDLIYTTNNHQLQKAVVDKNKIMFIDNDDEYIQRYSQKYNITKGEVARGYEDFAKMMTQNINKFEFMTFDYGEKYPRNDFSCRIYEKHNVFPIFDENIHLEKLYQKSDITYDVNFQHVIDSFKDVGIENIDYQTQLKALVSFGITELLDILKENVSEKTYLNEVNKVKTLLNPTGMGDRFKMVCFRKY